MTEKRPKTILCAVRGGPETRDTVTYAIELALEMGAGLTFFHAVDAEFLNHATIGPLSVVYREMVEMGQFIMLILCDRAERRGVSEVNCIVREGNVRNLIRQAAIDTHAELMVMGRPIRSPGSNVFKTGEIAEFATSLEVEGELRLVFPPQSS